MPDRIEAPAPVAIVAPFAIEIAPARRALASRKELREGGLRLWVGLIEPAAAAGSGPAPRTGVVAALGMGRRATEDALGALIDRWRPAAVALVGFAGGCVPEARPGDLYLPNPILVEPERGPDGAEIEGREPIMPSRPVVDAIIRAAGEGGARVRVAPGVTVNVPANPAAKDSLGRNRGAALCDMETFWAARLCAARGVPFAALRAIFDGVEEPAPPPRPPLRSIPRLAIRYLFRARPAYARVVGRLFPALAATREP